MKPQLPLSPVASAPRPAPQRLASPPGAAPARPPKPLMEFEVFSRAAAALAAQPEAPAILRREACELIAALGAGLVAGRDRELAPALRVARRHCGRLIALTAALLPAQARGREPDLRALHGSLSRFLFYLEKKREPANPSPAAPPRR